MRTPPPLTERVNNGSNCLLQDNLSAVAWRPAGFHLAFCFAGSRGSRSWLLCLFPTADSLHRSVISLGPALL